MTTSNTMTTETETILNDFLLRNLANLISVYKKQDKLLVGTIKTNVLSSIENADGYCYRITIEDDTICIDDHINFIKKEIGTKYNVQRVQREIWITVNN